MRKVLIKSPCCRVASVLPVPKLSRQLPTPNKTEKFYVVPTRSTLVLQLQTTVQGVFLVGGSSAAVVIHGRQIVQQVFCDFHEFKTCNVFHNKRMWIVLRSKWKKRSASSLLLWGNVLPFYQICFPGRVTTKYEGQITNDEQLHSHNATASGML